MIGAVRWVVTLYGTKSDAERLVREFPEPRAVEYSPSEYHRDVHLQLDDPEAEAPEGNALNVTRAVVQAHVRRIKGFGRLRWGRTFEGVEVTEFKTVDSVGKTMTIHFLEPGVDYLLPEDWVAMADGRGIPRARLPVGVQALSVLDGGAVTMLAAIDQAIALVLRLVDEMLARDEEIDLGGRLYSALEVIEQDLHDRGVDGQNLGWWTAKERRSFRVTANSVEVLGEHARHGKPFGLTQARMTSTDASWLVRRAAALWLTWRLEQAGNRPSKTLALALLPRIQAYLGH
jgi:hypothetical protein